MKTAVSLTPEELVRILAAARARRLRDWVMILITYWHGLRASETINLRVKDLADGYLAVTRGKGSEATMQPLQEHTNPLLNERAAIETWLSQRDAQGKKGGRRNGSKRSPQKMRHSAESVAFSAARPIENELLFPITRGQFWRLVRGYAIAAGIAAGRRYRTKRKTHALKHTIAKHLISDGVPLNELQAWLGWKDIRTAAIYTVADEDEVAQRVGRTIRDKTAFRREIQDVLFPRTTEPSQKPN